MHEIKYKQNMFFGVHVLSDFSSRFEKNVPGNGVPKKDILKAANSTN